VIRVKRPLRVPAALSGVRAQRAKAKLKQIRRNGRRPKSRDFDPIWGEKTVRQTLWQSQHKKCCYCERQRDVARESDIEHFRPKAAVTDSNNAGYWWLAYSWTNLLFSCRYCNQEHKKNFFPLLDEATRARTPRDRLAREQPVLIDPSREDPSQFIGFDFGNNLLVRPFGRDKHRRGLRTIEILGLDATELSVERASVLSLLQGIAQQMSAAQYLGNPTLIASAAANIRKETAPSRRFAGVAREYFRMTSFGDYVTNDD
jgi:uncharacterized protein (TIGR02646 family)